jgi:hypothetical protein
MVLKWPVVARGERRPAALGIKGISVDRPTIRLIADVVGMKIWARIGMVGRRVRSVGDLYRGKPTGPGPRSTRTAATRRRRREWRLPAKIHAEALCPNGPPSFDTMLRQTGSVTRAPSPNAGTPQDWLVKIGVAMMSGSSTTGWGRPSRGRGVREGIHP